MKRIFFFIITIVLPILTMAQEEMVFAPKGAKWVYALNDYGSPCTDMWSFEITESLGNAIYQERQCKELKTTRIRKSCDLQLKKKMSNESSNWDTTTYTRYYYVDENKVYLALASGDLRLVYNFDAIPGDIVSIEDELAGDWSIFTHGIDSVSDITINDITLKMLYPKDFEKSKETYSDPYGKDIFPIIERIGSTLSFLGVSKIDVEMYNQKNALLCYSDPQISYRTNWFPEIDCENLPIDIITNIEVSNNQEIEIFPNPAIDYIKIKHSKLKSFEVEIVGLDSILCISKTIKNSGEKIDISKLSSGYYILRILTDGEQIHTKKFYKY